MKKKDYIILVAYDGRGDVGMQMYYTVKAKNEDEALEKFVQYQEDYNPKVSNAEEKIHYEEMLAKVREGYGYGDSVGVCTDRNSPCSITIIEDEDE